MNIYRCGACGYIGANIEFKYGTGRQYGKHPEHRYCPNCSQSIDWHGYSVPCFGCPVYQIANKKKFYVNCIDVCPVLREQDTAVLEKYREKVQETKKAKEESV